MTRLLLSEITELYKNWSEHRVPSLAAALAYYAVFSLASILLICISIAGTLLGDDAARGQILVQVSDIVGKPVALQVQEIIRNANQPTTAFFAKIISIITLFWSSSGVFSEIQGGLNTIWGVKSNPNRKWLALIKSRFLSFAMVLISAFLLLISLVLSALLASLSSRINYFIGTDIFLELVMSYFISFLIITLLFAMMFKHLPDVKLQWKNVWIGALITSLLFSLGKILIGFYLNQVHIASVFGAAGSIIVLLIWVYYSAQIFFIGAEITKIYSTKKGITIRPTRNALSLK